jgi:hypothetical protein
MHAAQLGYHQHHVGGGVTVVRCLKTQVVNTESELRKEKNNQKKETTSSLPPPTGIEEKEPLWYRVP